MAPDIRLRTSAMLVLAVTCAAAVAGPPFLTDDPDPVDLHHAEIDLIGQQTRATAGRAGGVCAEANVGCAAGTQCHVAVPVAFDHPSGGRAQAGPGDVEFIGAIIRVAPSHYLLVSVGRGLTHVDTDRCSMFLPYQPEL